MVELEIGSTTTTDLKGNVKDYSVNAENIDGVNEQSPTWWDYPNSNQYLGYYKQIPELRSAILALAIWTAGKGFETDSRTEGILGNVVGWGEDSFQSIMENMIVQKKIFGDAFCEIIRNDGEDLVNLKPLYPGDMRVNVNAQGIIQSYEQRNRTGKGKPKKLRPDQVLHLCNDRAANEIHGTSVIESCQWVIDARNEALTDERKIKHRDLALGVLEIDTSNTTKINAVKTQYQNAVKNGEVLVLPKGVAEIKDAGVSPKDRLEWIRYLENFFYQAVGVPRVIATSEGFTEAGAKVGFLTFEPIYTREQTLLEQDLFNQLGLEIKFMRPPSLSGVVQEEEAKNTGQTGIQPSDTEASITRTE